MSASLITFSADSLTMTMVNPKSKVETTRLFTAKEFKDARGLKGQEAKKAYNDYLRTNGGASTAGLMAACSSGEMLAIGQKYSPSTGKLQVTFIEKSKIKDPVAKPVADPAIAAIKAQANAFKAALMSLGATEEQITALVAAAAAPAPAV